jgi:hypothetical protein
VTALLTEEQIREEARKFAPLNDYSQSDFICGYKAAIASYEARLAEDDELDRAFDRGYEKGVIDQIARQPAPAVARTPELEDLLDSIMSFADVDPDTQVKQIWRRKVAAVRTQAAEAGVKLPMVRALIEDLNKSFSEATESEITMLDAQEWAADIAAALAELDAAEGRK